MADSQLAGLIEESVRAHAPLPALGDHGGGTLTYAEAAGRVLRLHALFREMKLKKGAKVALLGRNSSGWAVGYLAALTYGAVAVPILPDFRPDDVHHIVNHSDSVLLLAARGLFEKLDAGRMAELKAVLALESVASRGPLDPLVLRKPADSDLLARAEAAAARAREGAGFSFEKPSEEDLAAIVYTSGTTGFSKGVMLPHRSLGENVVFARANMPLAAGDALVSFLPLAHAFGCAFEFLFPFTTGCHVTFLAQVPSPQLLLRAFSEARPRLVLTVPLVLEKVYARRLRPFLAKPAVRLLSRVPPLRRRIGAMVRAKLLEAFGGKVLEVVVGGAALAPHVERTLLQIGFPVTVGYGMTECGPLISYASWREHKPGAVGRPVDGMDVRIESPDPARVPGELLVRGPNVMLGYYKSPEATREVLGADGWLRTGDLAVRDADGTLFLKGRSKNVLLGPSGQNVYPEEIEARLLALPYVAEALVLERGGRLSALVYPDLEAVDGARLDEKGLSQAMERNRLDVNRQLPAWAALSRIDLVPEEFQKTPTRKVKRFLYAASPGKEVA